MSLFVERVAMALRTINAHRSGIFDSVAPEELGIKNVKLVPCECCSTMSYGYGHVCRDCGWEQQKEKRYTGQNVTGIKVYKFLYLLSRCFKNIRR